jgi:hypothetical protein
MGWEVLPPELGAFPVVFVVLALMFLGLALLNSKIDDDSKKGKK